MKISYLCSLLLIISHTLPAVGQQPPPPLKVGFSIGAKSITPAIMDSARAVGITSLNVSMNQFLDKSGEFNMTDDQIMEVVKKAKKIMDDAGMKADGIHMPFGEHIDISFPNEDDRRRVVALHKKVLRFAAVLQPKIVLFHPSWYLGLNERAVRKDQMVKSAMELLQPVKDMGAVMVIENMTGPHLLAGPTRERPLCRSVEEMMEIMDRLPQSIGGAVDMNHILHPERLILALGSRLQFLHVADGDGEHELHYLPCNGKGMNDWVAILDALQKVGYKGPFMYECHYNSVRELADCYKTLYNRFIAEKYPDGERAVSTGNLDALRDRLFPLYAALRHRPGLAKPLSQDPVLKEIGRRKENKIQQALRICSNTACLAEALTSDDEEKEQASRELSSLFARQPDSALLITAWEQQTLSQNYILRAYLQNKGLRYPKIDAAKYDVQSPQYFDSVKARVNKALMAGNDHPLFFQPTVDVCITILDLNQRDEAARYEPLSDGWNKGAVEHISAVDWKAYPYSAILVPGHGPEKEGVSIDSLGMARCRMAVELFKNKQAPFIIVSGGHVHPNRTPYCEAVEMKRYITEELHIPSQNILIEPYARHTTTNLRNAARMIINFSIPTYKPILTITDAAQSRYILNMDQRCIDEFGFVPYKNMKKINDYENEFFPVRTALQTNPAEPLDP